MLCYTLPVVAGFLLAGAQAQQIEYDINVISRNWGQITPYADNSVHYFGVPISALPAKCQVEQVHLLQRHAQRFPTSGASDGENNERFYYKVGNYTSDNPSAAFTGPLAFLNSYTYLLGESYLTGIGANTEFGLGVNFWQKYGRLLYDAAPAQQSYNAAFPNGTSRPRPVLRTTGQSRIENSQINWSLGFFGPSYTEDPNPTLRNSSIAYDVVIIPEGGTENNTLASYDSCPNSDVDAIGYAGDSDVFIYINRYLQNATQRLQAFAPQGFQLSVNDTYAMQSICAYESNYLGLGQSDFCYLFTADEWTGFENTLDILYYYDYSYGNPTGRAQGIGYLQELIARLTDQYITSSNSSVNSTIDNNPQDFPLGQAFYADFSHDDILISVMTAMSLDYINDPPTLYNFPPDPARKFVLSHLTPFGANLVTEVIGCADENPTPIASDFPKRVQYTPGQYGYNATNAPNKFIRMRLNNGILPLNTLRSGDCKNGRPDGMCAMESFLKSQTNSYSNSNYNFACFGNYTVPDPTSGRDWDGTIANCTTDGAECLPSSPAETAAAAR